jgi:hypothetical protein
MSHSDVSSNPKYKDDEVRLMALDGGSKSTQGKEVMGVMTYGNTTQLRLAVSSGIAVLDAHSEHWRRRVRWQRLNIGSPRRCLLAQLFGNFTDGRVRLGLTIEEAIACGFDSEDERNYIPLSTLWREVH